MDLEMEATSTRIRKTGFSPPLGLLDYIPWKWKDPVSPLNNDKGKPSTKRSWITLNAAKPNRYQPALFSTIFKQGWLSLPLPKRCSVCRYMTKTQRVAAGSPCLSSLGIFHHVGDVDPSPFFSGYKDSSVKLFLQFALIGFDHPSISGWWLEICPMFDPILDDVPLSLLGCCEITDRFLFWILLAFANRSVLWQIPTSVA